MAADRQILFLQVQVGTTLNRASPLDVHHKQVEIDHLLQPIQGNIQAKVDALENMMDAEIKKTKHYVELLRRC